MQHNNKAAIYARISRDENGENYESLMVQKQALLRYADENDFTVVDKYIDDDVSGYLFDDRPEFNRMQDDIAKGLVGVVIVKDLSRIGRNNPKTLLFLGDMQEENVRIIAVNDNYDSFKDDDDIIGIKTWYNERYVKDISNKIKAQMAEKQRSGNLLIRETFGYKKVGDTLQIDNVAAHIVQQIFSLYIEGYGYRKISQQFNAMDNPYPTPSSIENNNRATTTLWNPTHISRILKNDIYTGVFSLRKTVRKSIKSSQKKYIPEDEWIKIEDNHPAIISVEDFDIVQEIIKRRRTRNIRAGHGKINLFAGFLYCADCGSPMICDKGGISGNRSRNASYQCGNYHKHGNMFCSSHYIMEHSLERTIKNALSDLKLDMDHSMEIIDKSIDTQLQAKRNFDVVINKLKKQIGRHQQKINTIYSDKLNGIISEEMFVEFTQDIKSEVNILEQQCIDMAKFKRLTEQSEQEINRSVNVLSDMITKEELSREDLEIILDRMTINKDREIEELRWNFFVESMSVRKQVLMTTHWYHSGKIKYKEMMEVLQNVAIGI